MQLLHAHIVYYATVHRSLETPRGKSHTQAKDATFQVE
jgi:hypothetical protein